MTIVSTVSEAFGRAASTYDESAIVQRQSAKLLAKELLHIRPQMVAGPVLEIACGTGLFTEELLSLLKGRTFTISDLSENMLKTCQTKFDSTVDFIVLDAAHITESEKYALIVCSFGVQWFENIDTAFDGIVKALKPGGAFLFSVPTEGSFAEWKDISARLEIPFTGNDMPTLKQVQTYCRQRQLSADLTTTLLTDSYPSSLSFFQSLRKLGAQTKIASQKISSKQLRMLMRRWDQEKHGKIAVTYEVLCGVIKKN